MGVTDQVTEHYLQFAYQVALVVFGICAGLTNSVSIKDTPVDPSFWAPGFNDGDAQCHVSYVHAMAALLVFGVVASSTDLGVYVARPVYPDLKVEFVRAALAVGGFTVYFVAFVVSLVYNYGGFSGDCSGGLHERDSDYGFSTAHVFILLCMVMTCFDAVRATRKARSEDRYAFDQFWG